MKNLHVNVIRVYPQSVRMRNKLCPNAAFIYPFKEVNFRMGLSESDMTGLHQGTLKTLEGYCFSRKIFCTLIVVP